MNALLTLVRPFVGILAHRVGPDSLPASQFLLGLVIVAHVLVNVAILAVTNADSARLAAMPLIGTVAQAAFFSVLLSAMGFTARIVQTLTAMFGVDVLLGSLLVPIVLGLAAPGASAIAPVLSLAVIALMLWSLAVKGHILQRAVGLPYFVGVIIALAFSIAMLGLERTLFPV